MNKEILKQRLSLKVDKRFDEMFEKWLIDNPTFAAKGKDYTDMLKIYFSQWYMLGAMDAVKFLGELENDD